MPLNEFFRENDDENKRVAALRERRLKMEADDDRIRIAREVEEHRREEEEAIRRTDEFVRREAEEIDSALREADVQKAIEVALANPVDYEFAISKDGFIFHGRKTLSKKVPKDKWEKIEEAPKEEKKILVEQF